ncbi:hypothetical protein Q7689_20990, partial [Nocardiopsis tropica]|uniref:hypothetical protein n=1 Tax=Nocardiopsis tropica TaxID=109330 RepID=UPI002E88E50F|nr:hypothetical protein [Nocardiopsis tropica]
MSGWTPELDREYRQVAASLTSHHSGWWVMWSYSLRMWVAFFLGPAEVAPLRYADPDQLSRQMRYVLHILAAGRSP